VDGHLLRQALVNVIANALEALGGRGHLALEAHAVARPQHPPVAVDLVIRDDGPGIPAEVREKIFHPFVTTKKGGSGIGLAMARKIVECHHGLIDVTSSPGEGTAFRIRIPCRES
jgi:signal transduction histidine kinase